MEDYHVETAEFVRIVNETVESLPPQFKQKLDSEVIVSIEPLPAPRRGRIPRTLLGLYEGVPLTAWGRDYNGKVPDKITLYQQNIEAYARTPEEIPHIIRETLLHEIAHYFGFDHDKIGGMEQRWRQQRKQ